MFRILNLGILGMTRQRRFLISQLHSRALLLLTLLSKAAANANETSDSRKIGYTEKAVQIRKQLYKDGIGKRHADGATSGRENRRRTKRALNTCSIGRRRLGVNGYELSRS